MAKAKTIDRLELTRRNSSYIRNRGNHGNPAEEIPAQEAPTNSEHTQHGDKCPKCGEYTLHHVEGCDTCMSCGYSHCSIAW